MENRETEHAINVSDSVRDTINQDGAVLLDIEQGLCFSMNPVGAKIWEMLKQGFSPEAIVDGLEKEFQGVSRSQLEEDVTEFLQDLRKRSLIHAGEERKPKRSGVLSRFLRRNKSA